MSQEMSLRQLRIVWGAMIGGTVTYTAVVYVLTATGTVEMAAFGQDIMNIVGAVVMLQMVGAVVLRRRLVAAIPSHAEPDVRRSRYASATIIALALMEGGGLLLITFGMMTGSATWVLAGGGAAAVLMLFARPSEDEI